MNIPNPIENPPPTIIDIPSFTPDSTLIDTPTDVPVDVPVSVPTSVPLTTQAPTNINVPFPVITPSLRLPFIPLHGGGGRGSRGYKKGGKRKRYSYREYKIPSLEKILGGL